MKKLYYKYGTMNSGKTLEILRTAYNYEENGFKVLIVKPSKDKKGNDEIISRNGAHRKVDYRLTEDMLLSEQVKLDEVNAILVDEAQFLSPKQVEDLWMITKNKDIVVFCYGLKTDFQTHAFPGSIRLFELADKTEEITTLCSCGNKGMFNLRLINNEPVFDGDQVAIDGFDNVTYIPVCGYCYINNLNKAKEKIRQ